MVKEERKKEKDGKEKGEYFFKDLDGSYILTIKT